jgi:hypothetical protein
VHFLRIESNNIPYKYVEMELGLQTHLPLNSWFHTEVSCQLQALATLLPAKDLPVPTKYDAVLELFTVTKSAEQLHFLSSET